MSRYEWESGEFTLPAADVPRIKAALRDFVNSVRTDAKTRALELHRQVNTSNRDRYFATLRSLHAQRSTMTDLYGNERVTRDDLVDSAARLILEQMLSSTLSEGKGIRQPQNRDLDAVIPALTNRDNRFPLYGFGCHADAYVTFTGRTATYEVPENNHARDYADGSPMNALFFHLLETLSWTRGTGGYTSGNDEYNRDNRDYGAGANYLIRAYGPIGQSARINEHVRNGFSPREAKRMVALADAGFRR